MNIFTQLALIFAGAVVGVFVFATLLPIIVAVIVSTGDMVAAYSSWLRKKLRVKEDGGWY